VVSRGFVIRKVQVSLVVCLVRVGMSTQGKSVDFGALQEAPAGSLGRAKSAGPDPAVRSGDTRGAEAVGLPREGVVRAAAKSVVKAGRGPIPYDSRKFHYDRIEGKRLDRVRFHASRADRMDAVEAGEVLRRIHAVIGIAREPENVLMAFDKALFFEHSINGASLLQPGRGVLAIGDVGQQSEFDLSVVKKVLGPDQRRFFRAFADEIADVNREVLATYDPWDHDSAEKFGQLSRLAVERNLTKYPYLVHDSADACLNLSVEERIALMASKKSVLETTKNGVDVVRDRVDDRGKRDEM